MNQMLFFDSHGHPWVACPAAHPEAEAFGPQYIARRVRVDGFQYSEVKRRNALTYEEEGWTVLAPVGRDGDGCPTYEGKWGNLYTSRTL